MKLLCICKVERTGVVGHGLLDAGSWTSSMTRQLGGAQLAIIVVRNPHRDHIAAPIHNGMLADFDARVGH